LTAARAKYGRAKTAVIRSAADRCVKDGLGAI
jgi:hypothetical protein